MARVVQRPAARRDFTIHCAYLAEKAGLHTAKRFRDAVEATYAEPAHMPEIGVPGKIKQGRYAGVRLWHVRDFENYLIAYVPRQGGVGIERLIHAKQDYLRVLK